MGTLPVMSGHAMGTLPVTELWTAVGKPAICQVGTTENASRRLF